MSASEQHEGRSGLKLERFLVHWYFVGAVLFVLRVVYDNLLVPGLKATTTSLARRRQERVRKGSLGFDFPSWPIILCHLILIFTYNKTMKSVQVILAKMYRALISFTYFLI